MAEIRNTFVKSKMNKDLDDRLLSKGEYRNAENVQISRSEGEDVGALENVLGNNLITNWGLNSIANLEVIGYTLDQTNDRAFFIATNYTDVSDNELDNPAPYGASCYILMFDNKAINAVDKYKILVQGRFLNFSKTHSVYGIDLIEDLLFWTDNRNQPRKINVTKAIADNTYYNTEDQISVAKYYPYESPELWNEITITGISGSGTTYTSDDTTSLRPGMALSGDFYCYVKTVNYNPAAYGFTLTTNPAVALSANETFISTESKSVSEEYLSPSIFSFTSAASTVNTVTLSVADSSDIPLTQMQLKNSLGETTVITTISTIGANYVMDVSPNILPANWPINEPVRISWPNPEYVSSWPGDENYLREKFVRFAYRFRFDDGEYSVISPFTQPAFIPKRKGYIPSLLPDGSQTQQSSLDPIATSTVLDFFVNSVQEIKVKVPLPYAQKDIKDKLKLSQIQILYKESDGLAIKVLEEIDVTDLSITDTSKYYIYDYQSRRPFRVLPEKETLRVFDKVPIRALTQSVVGNRVVYGNFIDKHSPPKNLEYSINASEKYTARSSSTLNTQNRVTSNCIMSYPTHTLKQNRTYQVGIVLADRYGRQSDVILSSITTLQQSPDGGTTAFDGSTYYHPYAPEPINSPVTIRPELWHGDSLKILFANVIPETSTNEGYPGLYKSGEYTATVTPAVVNSTTIILQSGTLDPNVAIGDIITGPATGGGTFTTSIKSVNHATSTITVVDSISIDNTAIVTIHGPSNKLGWYTYKVVVKQLAQEYYNAFLGNICTIPTTAKINPGLDQKFVNSYMTTLVSDNINKIPADLGKVAPEQNQFGTSDTRLNIRIGGTPTNSSPHQFYFGTSTAGISAYGKVLDIGLSDSATVPETDGLWLSGNNPNSIILKGDKDEIFGALEDDPMSFSVVEVVPPVSRLDIYWETSTAGLISELNSDIINGSTVTPIPPLVPSEPQVPS